MIRPNLLPIILQLFRSVDSEITEILSESGQHVTDAVDAFGLKVDCVLQNPQAVISDTCQLDIYVFRDLLAVFFDI